MKKKLIIALIVTAIVLAAAVGAVVYLENKPAADPAETTAPVSGETAGTEGGDAEETTEATEPTEETIIVSLPTEDPSESMPEETFTEENEIPDYTMDPDATAGTEDRESNETPEDVFETGE